jgi:hypothetical protein
MKRPSPPQRKTGLRSGSSRAQAGPATPAVGAVLLDEGRAARGTGRPSAPKPAWPPKIRAAILARDDYCCVCCGQSILGQRYSIQDRDARGMGGTLDPANNRMSNGITMPGSGTTLCHGRVEDHDDPEDGPKGYRLENGQSPLSTPVWYVREFTAQWLWLADDGQLLDYNPVDFDEAGRTSK